MRIPFNKPCWLGTEVDSIRQAVHDGHISGNGQVARECARMIPVGPGAKDILFTQSCTAALEMAAILCAFKPGESVILPTFTHPGTANAFIRAGAKLLFADSLPDQPHIDPEEIDRLLEPGTKAVVAMHYMGEACDMGAIQAKCRKHGLLLIEDAAHAIGATYKGVPLGSIGDAGCISFHETKNITCGHGGLIAINNADWLQRARWIWQNGTNRKEFEANLVDHYSWVDVGSSYAMPDLNAAYLRPQLKALTSILKNRRELWDRYAALLKTISASGKAEFPKTNPENDHNAHIFYLKLKNKSERDDLLNHLNAAGIKAVFHYIPLHSSPYFQSQYKGKPLSNAQIHSDTIVRLPLFDALTLDEQDYIAEKTLSFFG